MYAVYNQLLISVHVLWQVCSNPLFNTSIAGPAVVEITGSPFSVNTTQRLQIDGIISGQPDPNITLYKVENEQEVLISNDQQRIMVDFVVTRLVITIEDVRVNDKGVYRVKAANEVGRSSTDFTVKTQGEPTTCTCTSM
jgi:hypothetical protein